MFSINVFKYFTNETGLSGAAFVLVCRRSIRSAQSSGRLPVRLRGAPLASARAFKLNKGPAAVYTRNTSLQ